MCNFDYSSKECRHPPKGLRNSGLSLKSDERGGLGKEGDSTATQVGRDYGLRFNRTGLWWAASRMLQTLGPIKPMIPLLTPPRKASEWSPHEIPAAPPHRAEASPRRTTGAVHPTNLY